tara:strand:+ start:2569 stop:3165 length:597 start_codon:yes stop_codon:yes gene_type:complete
MIKFIELSKEEPFEILKKKYHEALDSDQKAINALAISSFSTTAKEVDSRYVNLKYIIDNEFIFFTNYKSPKSKQFEEHHQVSALLLWDKIQTQIRIKANIYKVKEQLSDKHFATRSHKKNALAISSNQSNEVNSFQVVKNKFEHHLNNSDLTKRPNFWGGFAFRPYSFEFWTGNENRLNKRDRYIYDKEKWIHSILEP